MEDNTRVLVEFHTLRRDGALRVYRHRDVYRVEGLEHDSEARLVGHLEAAALESLEWPSLFDPADE